MRIVFITQAVDPESPVLGATVAKIRALAALVDEVVVLAADAVEGALPANCRTRLFAAGSQAGRGARFAAALTASLRPAGKTAIVAHMCPIYAVLAAPLARPLGVPVLLWFTHWRASTLLRVAERASTTVLTVDARTFPLASRKVIAIGHGIDLTDFSCRPARAGAGISLLVLGRVSPAKGLETIIRAVAQVPAARLRVVGPALTPEEREHRLSLLGLVAELGVGGRVELRNPVPRSEVPSLLAEADALVNNMREGATDKVVYEAAACCRPVLASNTAFDGLLPEELRFPREDVGALAARIAWLSTADRATIGQELREAVVSTHAVEAWARRVVEACAR